ncbi:MAG: bifunctional oligoribonuclease/PAP phosphatase NrnA [bacterium]|nr:bifunctional oligoribonuclease/PAP phosphatase NrnA [bacterium]
MSGGDRPAVIQALREGRSFLLLSHELPDGDSVGATLALARGLDQMGKRVTVGGADPVPRIYRHLPGADGVRPWRELDGGSWDIAVLLDCAEPARAGDAWKLASGARLVINIDHHVTNTGFGDLNLVDAKASATSEQVYDLLADLGVSVDAAIAACLFAGIMTDTGCFRYENTTPRALQIAAGLVEAGAEPGALSAWIWESRHPSTLRLLARALDTLTTNDGGRIAWMTVDDGMLAETGADEEEVEGFVNYPRSLEGVEVALMFRTFKAGGTRVALRSKTYADVSRIARALGGGGHPRAAGCLLDCGLEEAVARVLAEVRKEVSP